jgi:hypothetical protein
MALLACLAAALAPQAASANVVNEEKEIYLVRPLTTEPAWTQTGFYFNSMLFDLPNAVSRPSAQVGFVFTPGLTWSILGILELNLGFPLVLNPDATGAQELRAADHDPALKNAPQFDSTPDFDLPGLLVGLKANLLGRKGEDRFFLAIGVSSSIPLGTDEWSTNFMAPKTEWGHANSMRIAPYVALAYEAGRFSPQLQLGGVMRLNEKFYDPEFPPLAGDAVGESNYFDFFFNLALPFAFLYEGTAPILEINGVIGEQGTQLFITPAVTFLPKGSPALLSFACQIPIYSDDFRENEGFRFLVNFSYRLDVLSIPALGGGEEGSSSDETPPAGW